MRRRPTRSRLLDLAVAMVCVACVAAPLLPVVTAAPTSTSSAVVESGGTVDQRVLQSGVISDPLDATFESVRSGRADGTISWDLYTTSRSGMKLVLSSDRDPAMRDARNGIDVPDFDSGASVWSVPEGSRAFGFTASGTMTLSRFADGTRWRGFDGDRGIEVARRGSPTPRTRTTVRLRAELASGLPSDARVTATIRGTGVVNL